MHRLLTLTLLLLAATHSAAEDRFAGIEIKTQKLTDHIYMLTGAGGNIGLSVGDDGILMVDDQYAAMAPKIKAVLANLGDDTPAYVLNTHFHGDHTGGNATFGRDSIIIAHDNVRVRLLSAAEAPAASSLPVITYNDEVSVFFNGEDIRLLHMPVAHTDTDTFVHFKTSNVLHLGDIFWNGLFPFVDIDSGGNVDGVMQGIAAALALCNTNTQVIPGHGPLGNPTQLQAFQRMLQVTSDLVKAQIAAGASLDEILAAGLGAEWAAWGSGFITQERWLRTLYRSYAS
jgi:cyclase